MVYAYSLENCRTETFREFESHALRQVKGSVQQTKTLKCYDSLSGQNDPVIIWALSSAGRAPALQAGGQEFDPPRVHQVTMVVLESRLS